MSHAVEVKQESYTITLQSKRILWTMVGLGMGVFALGLVFDAQRLWVAFLHNHFFFMSLSLGGLFFCVVNIITGARWFAPLRRISEAIAYTFPLALLSFLGFWFAAKDLYQWAVPDFMAHDPVLAGKAGYLNFGFFWIRNLLIMLVFLGFGRFFLGKSLLQDKQPELAVSLYLKTRKLAPIFLILFTLGFTMQSFDQIMSLDPAWFSTIFGVYCFAGLFYSSLALITVIGLHLKSRGKLAAAGVDHFHDMGKYMFAFTVFWTYIAFSQFLLIWYANLPEEISFYLLRFQPGWLWFTLLLLLKFVIPFFLLLSRFAKRSPKVLQLIGVFMLVAQWIDCMWLIQPNFFAGPLLGWLEVGILVGFAGAFGLVLTHFLSKHWIMAVNDPFLGEALHHHQ
jgi:hypothetical protein